MPSLSIETDIDLRPFTTLRAGGRARMLAVVRSADALAEGFLSAELDDAPPTVLGYGSNVLPSDAGVPGLVLVNLSSAIEIGSGGEVLAETGCSFQELFLKTAQAGLAGLEFAVGIPGTLGGALVSNAGAYRSNVGELVADLEIASDGERRWVGPEWLGFSYRNSVLRRPNPPRCALLRVKLKLEPAFPRDIYDRAREFQRQRISKQPPPASAGSFFKNVVGKLQTESLPDLPAALKEAGVVPAGYLLQRAGMKGVRYNGAMFSPRHGNFIVNVGGASASDIRCLATKAKLAVEREFGVTLEEEVLYVGDWSGFE